MTEAVDSLVENVESNLNVKTEKTINNAMGIKRTDDIKSKKNLEFSDLGLKPEVIKAIISASDWRRPSPIQEELIPIALQRKNIVARAKNGTGKTGSFILPILNLIDLNDRSKIEALVLCPTRELAMQTSKNIINLQNFMTFTTKNSDKNDKKDSDLPNMPKTILLNGGQPAQNQILVLKDHKNQGIKVAVATCGRVFDLARKKVLPLEDINIVVLDEADRLLHDQNLSLLKSIFEMLPRDCQKILVSATFSDRLTDRINELVGDYETINLMETLSLEGITPFYCCIDEKDKVKAINTIFKRLRSDQSMIFVKSSTRAIALHDVLDKIGYSCAFIHSQLHQSDRNQIFNSFKKHQYRLMICTDILKRGIDNSNISVVINFDLPISAQHYLHRVGRAGRYGRRGISIDFVTPEQKNDYAKLMHALAISPTPVPEKIDQSLYMNF